MKLNHIALATHSEEQSDRFFIDLLGLQKSRSFTVSAHLMKAFFGTSKDGQVIRYSSDWMDAEVFVAEQNDQVKDRYTHVCIEVENQTDFVQRAQSMGFEVIRVKREPGDSYYIFIKDPFGNSYEIK